jgi:hypothetical protein
MAAQQQQPQPMNNGMGQATMPQPQIDQATLSRMMSDHLAYQQYEQKVKSGMGKYPDFEKAVTELNLPQNPHLNVLANSVDNSADVLYDLANNPRKVADLHILAHTNPAMAQREITALSNSIKQNEAAKAQAQPNSPIEQLKPQTQVSMGSGTATVSDLRKIYRG